MKIWFPKLSLLVHTSDYKCDVTAGTLKYCFGSRGQALWGGYIEKQITYLG